MADQQSETSAPTSGGLQPLSQQKNLDAHQTAPPELKAFFKRHSNPFPEESDELIDFEHEEAPMPGFERISKEQVDKAFTSLRSNEDYMSTGWVEALQYMDQKKESAREAYSFKKIPGEFSTLCRIHLESI